MARPEIPQEVVDKYVEAAWVRVSKRVETSVREKLSFLTEHPDLVEGSSYEEILGRELVKAQQEYKQRRLEGGANDNFSRKPGMKVYLRYTGFITAIHQTQKAGYPFDESQMQQEITPFMSTIDLPIGVYAMGMGGCQFYKEADEDFDQKRDGRRKPFALSYDQVIRVEGTDGELWQNVNYNRDGSPKNSQ